MIERWFSNPLIGTSATIVSDSAIRLIKTRTLYVTVRLKFTAAATGDATVNFYHSPEGKLYDTEALDNFTLTCDAGEYVQKGDFITAPEHGWIRAKITNADASKTITEVQAWYSMGVHMSFEDWAKLHKGEVTSHSEAY